MFKQQDKPKTKPRKIPHGNCGNPRCKHVWLLRVEKPIKCPRCGGTNIFVE